MPVFHSNFVSLNPLKMKTVKTQPYAIPLENVESEHCAMIVNKGLQTVTEISQLKVALNNKQAIIETDKPEIKNMNLLFNSKNVKYNNNEYILEEEVEE